MFAAATSESWGTLANSLVEIVKKLKTKIMNKSETLENEINLAIKKISSLTVNDRIEVHNIFLNIFNDYLNLPKEEFINEYYYCAYKKTIDRFKPFFESELSCLLDLNDNTNVLDNFFHIKGSLLMMIPKGVTK